MHAAGDYLLRPPSKASVKQIAKQLVHNPSTKSEIGLFLVVPGQKHPVTGVEVKAPKDIADPSVLNDLK